MQIVGSNPIVKFRMKLSDRNLINMKNEYKPHIMWERKSRSYSGAKDKSLLPEVEPIEITSFLEGTHIFSRTRWQPKYRNGSSPRHYFSHQIAAIGPYAFDMLKVSPVLSIVAFHKSYPSPVKAEIVEGIKNGVSAKKLHRLAQIPWSYRRLSPVEARQMMRIWNAIPQQFFDAYAPESGQGLLTWLAAYKANVLEGAFDPSTMTFTHWLLTQPVWDTGQEYRHLIVKDWYLACDAKKDGLRSIATAAVEKLWHNKMSFEAASEHHDLWAARLCELKLKPRNFPAAWFSEIQLSEGYSFAPIKTNVDLRMEGAAMRHCVLSYEGRVDMGRSYIYSLRKGQERALTVELVRAGSGHGRVRINQALGLCNRKPSKSEEKILGKLREHFYKTPTFL